MPKFNMNWIYILALLALTSVYFFGGDTTSGSSINKQTSYDQFKVYVQKGYAQKITVNKAKNELKMYVKAEHFREVFKAGAEQTGPQPYVLVAIGSVDRLEAFVEQQRSEGHFKGDYGYENKGESVFYNMLYSILPIFLIFFFWILLFRRMGSGGGMSGISMGQCHNYNKKMFYLQYL